MTVKSILASKGHEVVTIPPAALLRDAVTLLNERRIGAVVVVDGADRAIGILSERDIVRRLAQHGAEALHLAVENVMTRRLVTCQEGDTVGDVMEQMTHGKFRHVPVVEGDRLIGLVSIGDVVKYRLGEFEAESSALKEYILNA